MSKRKEEEFDEFGNFIGSVSEDEDEAEEDRQDSFEIKSQHSEEDTFLARNNQKPFEEPSTELIERPVLHEEKQYYPEFAEAYPQAETLVQEEDLQGLNEPLIQPPEESKFYRKYKFDASDTHQSFLEDLQQNPKNVRNVAVVGAKGSGKSKLCDLLIRQQKTLIFRDPQKYLTNDTQFELKRKLTVTAKPFSLVLPDSSGKHYLCNLIDTPGHSDFFDEVRASLELVDGVIFVVDALEGVGMVTRRIAEEVKKRDISAILVVNKLDRLIIETKVPPEDAYLKIRLLIDEMKEFFDLSPTNLNVMFASSRYNILFDLSFFANKNFKSLLSENVRPEKLLWGNIYFDDAKNQFMANSKNQLLRRTFVEFVLVPIYKIFSHVVAKEKKELRKFLMELNLEVKNKSVEEMSLKDLLKEVFSNFILDVPSLITNIVKHINDVSVGNNKILERITGRKYTQHESQTNKNQRPNPDNQEGKDKNYKKANIYSESSVNQNDGSGDNELLVIFTKLFPEMPALADPPKSFYAFGRILSGSLSSGTTNISLCDSETHELFSIAKPIVSLPNLSHFKFQAKGAVPCGSLIYVSDAGNFVNKQGFAFTAGKNKPRIRFEQLGLGAKVKLGIEPISPVNLPQTLQGLQWASKTFTSFKTKIEESGEHLILGTGEMLLDTALDFLRNYYISCEIRLSEPACLFAEGIAATSQMFARAQSKNRMNSLEFIAEPLEKSTIDNYRHLKLLDFVSNRESYNSHAHDNLRNDSNEMVIEQDVSKSAVQGMQLEKYLTQNLKWDMLTTKSLWTFGEFEDHPVLLFDDSLPFETDKDLLKQIKPSIINGFNWAVSEGPLCEEPFRELKLKLTKAQISQDPRFRTSEQIAPIARKAIHTALLLATPRLYEPYYDVEIICSQDSLQTIYTILSRRRGQLLSEKTRSATNFFELLASIPILESFGFETDVRTQTFGQAMVSVLFKGWEVVPGDPLDRKAKIPLLEPCETLHLARDIMVKTRLRKGLTDEISLFKYFDDEKVLDALRQGFSA